MSESFRHLWGRTDDATPPTPDPRERGECACNAAGFAESECIRNGCLALRAPAPSEADGARFFKFWSDHGVPVAWVVLDASKDAVRAAHPFFVEREAERFAAICDRRSPHEGPHTVEALYTHPAPAREVREDMVAMVRAKYAHVNEADDRFVLGYNAALDALSSAMEGA